MISRDTLEELRDEFCTASWALWSDRFPRLDSIESTTNDRSLAAYFAEKSTRLRPDLVLLGLNPSGPYPSDYQNFHSIHPRHNDVWLRVFVEESGLQGAYMTDIVEVKEPDSGKVDIQNASPDRFIRQLTLLNRDNFTVIAFGRDAFRVVASFDENSPQECGDDVWLSKLELGGYEIELYGVYHYSQVNPENAVKLRIQLSRLAANMN